MRVPPRWLRRIILSPLPVLVLLLFMVTVPLIFIFAFVFSYLLPGKWRAFRVAGIVFVYLVVESAVVVAAFGLWVGRGFGARAVSDRYLEAHYRLLGWALRQLVWATERLFTVTIVPEGQPIPGDDGDPATREVPLIVMSRHAGPADSLLVVHQVMSWGHRRPRIVAKDLLQLDPGLDILLNRLPNRFISPNPKPGAGTVESIGELAATMTERDAFVIFPEGGNFTAERQVRAIDRLRESGRVAAAERAAGLRNLLPPRPAGVRAALDACPSADAVFVAHTGLDDVATLGDIWTALPNHKTVQMAWHVVPAGALPTDRERREDMLFRAWEAIDAWVETQSESSGVPGVAGGRDGANAIDH